MTQKKKRFNNHIQNKERQLFFFEKQNYKMNGTLSHLLFTAKTEIEPLLTVIASQPASSSESLQRTLHQNAAA